MPARDYATARVASKLDVASCMKAPSGIVTISLHEEHPQRICANADIEPALASICVQALTDRAEDMNSHNRLLQLKHCGAVWTLQQPPLHFNVEPGQRSGCFESASGSHEDAFL